VLGHTSGVREDESSVAACRASCVHCQGLIAYLDLLFFGTPRSHEGMISAGHITFDVNIDDLKLCYSTPRRIRIGRARSACVDRIL
jgi:hypothetical protein